MAVLRSVSLALLLLAVPWASGVPPCVNGGFEQLAGWSVYGGQVVARDPGRCLALTAGQTARQDLPVLGGETCTVRVDLRTADITPDPGQRGYAYAAVYQLDAAGELVVFKDFATRTGTVPWQTASHTFTMDPRTRLLSLRCGVFQATGEAWFDNWAVGTGDAIPAAPISSLVAVPQPRRAAILADASLPRSPGASAPPVLAGIIAAQGVQSEFLTAVQLASPEALHAAAFALLVLPDAPVFPAAARANVVRYLQTGGSLVAVGGYPFSRMLALQDGTWVPQEEAQARALEETLSADHSLLADGDFEQGVFAPGWQAGALCRVVAEEPKTGKGCVLVAIPEDGPREAVFLYSLPAHGTGRYAVVASLRTQQVRAGKGTGYAFVAIYQYDEAGNLLVFKDFATQVGDSPWHEQRYLFQTEPATVRVELKAGIYNATGVAWFDDLRLVPYAVESARPLNTASGRPEDGLVTTPDQIGLCDPSFPFRRTVGIRRVGGEALAEGPVAGWPATAVIGNNDARWTPLLEGHDRYGRSTGAALALVRHYRGFYRGSAWLACGVESRDLFAAPESPLSQELGRGITRLLDGCFLHELRASPRLVVPGEPLRLSCYVANYGSNPRSAQVRILVNGRLARTLRCAAASYADTIVEAELTPTEQGLLRVEAELLVDGLVLDRMETGCVVGSAMPDSPPARFRDNGFSIGERSFFLFGTDSFAYTYTSAHESPLTWSRDHAVGRDFGLNLYENLQFSRGPAYELTEDDWKDFRAMAWLTQRNGLVFMPGVLIGQDVAVDDAMLARQSRLCEEYARHCRDVPALHLYLNGDYKSLAWQGGEAIDVLWNRWLKTTYGDLTHVRETWGSYAPTDLAWPVPYPQQRKPDWDNPVAVSRARFHVWLTQRWNRTHAAAIRRQDTVHPIMSEYYRLPLNGIDLPLTVDDLDVADIGYFNPPEHDLETLPLAIRWSDQRLRGKGICLGEYGVKTHPAWASERGGTGYHIARTELEQSQLAVAVAHYGLGMGAAKMQNWCLRDAQTRVFPWGLFYPNDPLPKPWAYAHRNLSLVWRFLSPLPDAPRLAACVPVAMRLGNRERVGFDLAERTFASLLNLRADFATIQDCQIAELPASVRTLVYPAAMAVADADFAALRTWVRQGGNLLVTGSMAYDEHRRGGRFDRLLDLCGVAVESQSFADVERQDGQSVRVAPGAPVLAGQEMRPAVRVSLAGAALVAAGEAGQPLVTEFELGEGRAVWCADPLSLGTGTDALREQLYGWFLERVGEPVMTLARLEADAPVHVFRRSLRQGSMQIAFATRANSRRTTIEFADGDGTAGMEPGWPAMVARQGQRIVALGGIGELSAQGHPLLITDRQLLALSLDGQSLPDSAAWILAPLQGAGEVTVTRDVSPCLAVFGEFQDGQWVERERVELARTGGKLVLDADRATCVVLICLPQEIERWTRYLSEAMVHPEQMDGY